MAVRERLTHSLMERGASAHELMEAREVLDPFVLTIGFARRFATYKRATLFFARCRNAFVTSFRVTATVAGSSLS